jgi:replicative DNA helicase
MNDQSPAEILYPASEATALTLDLVKHVQGGNLRGIPFGTSRLNRDIMPAMPGDLVLVCARPGNGKTFFVQHMLGTVIDSIIAEEDPDGAVVYITWETSIEQAAAAWLAQASGMSSNEMLKGNVSAVQQSDLMAAAVNVGSYPLYIVGHSIQRSKDGKRRRPHITTDAVAATLDHLMNERAIEPRLIVLDYLQRIPFPRGLGDRSEHMTRCIDWSKDTAFQAGCPVILCTQARREVDSYAAPIPTMGDSQWSSNAEQSADKFFSLWMPKNTHAGKRIEIAGSEISVSDNLLVLSLMKQKFGRFPMMFPMHVEPELLRLSDMDLRGDGARF